jgi:hypothetical protein
MVSHYFLFILFAKTFCFFFSPLLCLLGIGLKHRPRDCCVMLRRTSCRAALYGSYHRAPSVYPFPQPFKETIADGNVHPKHVTRQDAFKNNWPQWMDEGMDGTGHGIGLHRTHPLSDLRGNLRRTPSQTPRIFNMMMKGVWHKSGVKLYFRGGKPPNPSTHPYLTGEPCPVYGWRVMDHQVTRQFNVPALDKDKIRYKPYVALQERKFMTGTGAPVAQAPTDVPALPTGQGGSPAAKDEKKPLLKRLFFWQ